MKNFWFLVAITFSFSAQAQYYYKDFIGTRDANQLIKFYTINKVQSVTLTSYDADGSVSADFFVQQVLLLSANILKTITRSGVTDESVLTTIFDSNNRIIKTTDTSSNMINVSNYVYDDKGNLTSIKSFSTDSAQSISETEEHNWFYDAGGKPESMQRIVNKSEPAVIRFVSDEKGNIIEEQTFKKGIKDETVYYYYDAKNRMTDVVRYNKKAKKLLPDYMFEYSEANQVIQKITVPASGSNYLIWRYQYDAKGLKIREACFDRQKQLTGKIEYNYRFAQ